MQWEWVQTHPLRGYVCVCLCGWRGVEGVNIYIIIRLLHITNIFWYDVNNACFELKVNVKSFATFYSKIASYLLVLRYLWVVAIIFLLFANVLLWQCHCNYMTWLLYVSRCIKLIYPTGPKTYSSHFAMLSVKNKMPTNLLPCRVSMKQH